MIVDPVDVRDAINLAKSQCSQRQQADVRNDTLQQLNTVVPFVVDDP